MTKNKLEKHLNRNSLQGLFEESIYKIDDNAYAIQTSTHKIILKNPKIT